MGRAGHLVCAAVLGGLAIAIAIDIWREPRAHVGAPAPETLRVALPSNGDIERCRTVTAPDPECEAAWDERRRQFFGRKEGAR
jgi:conjugative transfer region protein TrbK